MSAKQAVRAHSLIYFKTSFCLDGNWSVDHLPLCEIVCELTPHRCYPRHCTVWLETVSFPKSYGHIWSSIGQSMCAVCTCFTWVCHSVEIPFTLKMNENPFLFSKHCDNVIVSPGMPHSVQKIAGSRTVSKVSAADTAQDGS